MILDKDELIRIIITHKNYFKNLKKSQALVWFSLKLKFF